MKNNRRHKPLFFMVLGQVVSPHWNTRWRQRHLKLTQVIGCGCSVWPKGESVVGWWGGPAVPPL